ncbi:unnamed protein product [Cuscuta campestris]|uniref:Growth-regulating factor n=2 Tax=Cuscuta sect. Cleistogrammica TaxID=1824901 RepID=A0A484KM80_9ASTE|nr:hypothetical protein DM860_001883 [Cuscuta australis]VFQ66440.1 unnamed protein product [Cuscuta campestris]
MSVKSTPVAGDAAVLGYGYGYRTPFTAVQWQELEHQAMIYKYLVAGVPVPPQLVVPVRRSFEALSATYFQHPTLVYGSNNNGKKYDPEPGRCRRSDGKKWRCSKDVYPDSKYCEHHMNRRSRNRSRKPVESQATSLGMWPASSSSYALTENDGFRNPLGMNLNADDHDMHKENSAGLTSLGLSSGVDCTWSLLPPQVSSHPGFITEGGSRPSGGSFEIKGGEPWFGKEIW